MMTVFLAALSCIASHNNQGIAPHQAIMAGLNESATFACNSNGGAPLSSFICARTAKGQRQVDLLQQDDEYIPVEGVEYLTKKLNEGSCGVSISSIQEAHYGPWSCILITTEGVTFSAKFDVKPCKIILYFVLLLLPYYI